MDVLDADTLLIADSDFSRYRPAYVEAFLENRVHGDDQTIEEWTDVQGRALFSNDEIYEPCSIGVRVMGSEANLFQFDGTQASWCESLTQAVREMLISHQLADEHSEVTLVDIRGTPVATKNVDEISDGGELLVTVDGKRLLDETRLARQIGLPLATPVSHAPNKEELLEEHVNAITVEIRDLVLDALSKVENMVAAEGMICNEDAPDNLLKPIAALIKANAGHAKSFAHLLDIHGAPDVVEALQNARITEDDFAEDIAGAVLDEVAQSMQAQNMRVSDYFTAKQMEHSNLFASVGAASSSSSSEGKQARTIFGSQVRMHTEQIGQILQECPSTRHMFQPIVDHALFQNQQLEGKINVIIKKGCDKHCRRNKRSVYRHKRGHQHGGHKDHHHHHHAHRHGAKLREYHFSDTAHHHAMHSKMHRLLQIAPAPGTQPLVVQEDWHKGRPHSHQEDWHGHHHGRAGEYENFHGHHHHGQGQMENYKGGGSFPHSGLHDARYSQNTSVATSGSTTTNDSRRERVIDRTYGAEYEKKHHHHHHHGAHGAVVAGVPPVKAVRRPGPADDDDEADSSDEEHQSFVTYNTLEEKVRAPNMELHKDVTAASPVVKVSPDTKSITVTKDQSAAAAAKNKKEASPSLPPAAEVVSVVKEAISDADMALIRATLRSAEAVTETTFKLPSSPVAKQTRTEKKPAAAVATTTNLVREEPPSLEAFSAKTTPATTTVTGLQGGYKVHQRVAPAVAVNKAPASPATTTVVPVPKVVLPDVPVQKHVDNALSTMAAAMDDGGGGDMDLDMFLIPQASATPTIRV